MDVSGAFLASVFLKVSWAIGKSFFLFEENLLGGVIHLFRLHYLQLAGLIPAARSRSAALHGPSHALTSSSARRLQQPWPAAAPLLKLVQPNGVIVKEYTFEALNFPTACFCVIFG